jgi:hypothetical protein
VTGESWELKPSIEWGIALPAITKLTQAYFLQKKIK